MYCSNCGEKQVSNDAKFCFSCGNKLITSSDISTKGNEITNQVDQNQNSAPQPNETRHTYDQGSISDEELLRAFVGEEKKDYYHNKWQKGKRSWNWASFFLTLFWVGYRKMYGVIALVLGFFIVFDLVVALMGVDSLSLNNGIGIALAVCLGMVGNQMYKGHALKKINKLKAEYGNTEALVQAVKSHGGKSWTGFWLTLATFVVYIVVGMGITYYVPPLSVMGGESVTLTVKEDQASVQPTTTEEKQDEIQQPTNTFSTEEEIKQQVTAAIEANLEALRNEDIDAYMRTIYLGPETEEIYNQTKNLTEQLFGNYDLTIDVQAIEFIHITEEEVQVRYSQTTKQAGEGDFRDNSATTLNTLRIQDGEWKFVSTITEEVSYLDTHQVAEEIYQQSCIACHGTDLKGTDMAPDLTSIGSEYSKDEIQNIIINGIPNTGMPSGVVSQEEARILTDWLSTKQ